MKRQKLCQCCNKMFESRDTEGRGRWETRQFCSHTCAYNSRQKRLLETRLEKYIDLTPGQGPYYENDSAIRNNCHVWTGAKNKDGYGIIKLNRKTFLVHRIIFELSHCVSLTGQIRHRCDNPACVNPDHLLEGTFSDNMKDKQERNRQAAGERQGLSKLKDTDIPIILASRGTQRKLAQEYDVTQGTIWSLKSGRTWKRSAKKEEV